MYFNHNKHISYGFDGGYLVRDCLLGFVHHALQKCVPPKCQDKHRTLCKNPEN